MEILAAHGKPEGGSTNESLVRLAYVVTLEAVGEHDAAVEALVAAHERLLERAAQIEDPAWRQSFLTRVPNNARTVALAREWGCAVPT